MSDQISQVLTSAPTIKVLILLWQELLKADRKCPDEFVTCSSLEIRVILILYPLYSQQLQSQIALQCRPEAVLKLEPADQALLANRHSNTSYTSKPCTFKLFHHCVCCLCPWAAPRHLPSKAGRWVQQGLPQWLCFGTLFCGMAWSQVFLICAKSDSLLKYNLLYKDWKVPSWCQLWVLANKEFMNWWAHN